MEVVFMKAMIKYDLRVSDIKQSFGFPKQKEKVFKVINLKYNLYCDGNGGRRHRDFQTYL